MVFSPADVRAADYSQCLPLVLTRGVYLFKKRVVFSFHLLCLREPPSCLNTQSDQNQNEPDFLAVWLNSETQEPVSYLSELHRFLSVAMTADGPTRFVKAAPPHRFDPGQTVLTRNARRFLSVRAIRLPITLVSEREEKPPVIFIRLLRFSSFSCICYMSGLSISASLNSLLPSPLSASLVMLSCFSFHRP